MPRVIITVPGTSPQPYLFQLDRKSVTLGRGSINDIVLDCPSVSVKHAEMRRVEGGYELRDLGSTNGIRIHGERRETIVLHDGDSPRLGDVAFDFTLNEEEKAQLATERPQEESPIIKEPVQEDEAVPDAAAAEESGSGDREENVPARGQGDREKDLPHATKPGCAWMVWTLIIAVLAFSAGMAVRFERETDTSWLRAAKERFFPSPPKSPPPSVPLVEPNVDSNVEPNVEPNVDSPD